MIYVITHKQFDDSIIKEPYKVLHVGENDNYKLDYLRDNSGDNISSKNPWFCELTGLYWIWKNALEDDEISGIVHYRRFFTTHDEYNNYIKGKGTPTLLDEETIYRTIIDGKVILPTAYRTLSTLRNSYKRCHDIADLDLLENTIKRICPEYIGSYKSIMRQHYGYYYNMIICQGRILKDYCSWLFPILFEVEVKLVNDKDTAYQRRVYGFLAERLLQVWIKHNRFDIVEYPVFNVEEKPMTFCKRNIDRARFVIKKYF